ncbi:MAG: ribbon-helix-helix protein, CopG family [Opitutales bacterium]|nr:ribbon-helix-helix protein, CopG family [Opitutales bacterium]
MTSLRNEAMGKKKEDTDSRKNTSLRLEKKVLKTLKVIAIEEDTSVQKIIEELIYEYLRKKKKL